MLSPCYRALGTPRGFAASFPTPRVLLSVLKASSDMVLLCNLGSKCCENNYVARQRYEKPCLGPLLCSGSDLCLLFLPEQCRGCAWLLPEPYTAAEPSPAH